MRINIGLGLIVLGLPGQIIASECCLSSPRVASLESSVWEDSRWISAKEAPAYDGPVKDGMKAAPGTSLYHSGLTLRELHAEDFEVVDTDVIQELVASDHRPIYVDIKPRKKTVLGETHD